MPTKPSIVIDYGTSKSVITWLKPGASEPQIVRVGGDDSTPSAVYFDESGAVLVGAAVVERIESGDGDGAITSPKRSLGLDIKYPGYGNPTPITASAAILRYLLEGAQGDAEVAQHLDGPITRAAITCPATFTTVEQDNLIKAGKLAGLKEVTLVHEPVSAGLACSISLPDVIGKTVLVYDLGAGTFDVAVLSRNEEGKWKPTASPTGVRLGGDDFDLALYLFLDEMARGEHGEGLGDPNPDILRKCRKSKESAVIYKKTPFSHRLPNEKFFKCTVTQDDIYRLIRTKVEETIGYVERAKQEAEQNGTPVDSLILIGGSSRIPLIEELVIAALDRPPLKWSRREYAVALGAHYDKLNGDDFSEAGATRKPLSEYKLGEQIGEPLLGHQKLKPFNNGARVLVFSPDSKWLVSGGLDQSIRKWDIATGKQVGDPWLGHEGEVTALCFSHDGSLLISGGEDGTVRIWDFETGTEICEPFKHHKGRVLKVACRLDDAEIVSGSEEGNVVRWNPESRAVIAEKKLQFSGIRALEIARDLIGMTYGGNNNFITLSYMNSSTYYYDQSCSGAARSLDYQGGNVFASAMGDNHARIHVWTSAPKCIRSMAHPEPVMAVKFCPDGSQLLTACSDGRLRLWDAETGELIGEPWIGHHRVVWCIAFSPDGKLVASGGNDCTIRLWKAADDTVVDEKSGATA